MMKFQDYEYSRPDLVKIDEQFDGLLHKFNAANSFAEQNSIMKELNTLRSNVGTMKELVFIRHSINTEDEYYAKEQDFFDENMPIYQNSVSKFQKALVASKYRAELEKVWGKQLFTLAELELKTFSEEIMADLVVENKLETEYEKLIASAKIFFEV